MTPQPGAVAVTLTGSSVYSTGGAAVSALQSGNAGVTVTGTGAGLLSSTGNVGVVATHGGTGAGDVSVTLWDGTQAMTAAATRMVVSRALLRPPPRGSRMPYFCQ